MMCGSRENTPFNTQKHDLGKLCAGYEGRFLACRTGNGKNSIIKGEYLAWYSSGVTFIHCTIIGAQPFCYCKNLKLVDCKMVDTDLCFEKSEVNATITTPVISIKIHFPAQSVPPLWRRS